MSLLKPVTAASERGVESRGRIESRSSKASHLIVPSAQAPLDFNGGDGARLRFSAVQLARPTYLHLPSSTSASVTAGTGFCLECHPLWQTKGMSMRGGVARALHTTYQAGRVAEQSPRFQGQAGRRAKHRSISMLA